MTEVYAIIAACSSRVRKYSAHIKKGPSAESADILPVIFYSIGIVPYIVVNYYMII